MFFLNNNIQHYKIFTYSQTFTNRNDYFYRAFVLSFEYPFKKIIRIMNRRITNTIRFFMDECLPPLIRDNRIFMLPFFHFAYRGKKIKEVMDFKKNVYNFSAKDYDNFYNNLDTISRNRATDLNQASLSLILKTIPLDTEKLIDIGSGNGYLLKQVKKKHPKINLFGFDIKNTDAATEYTYVKGNIEALPFGDKSFDVVTCSHVLEHIIDLDKAIAELKRITKKTLIIAVPCQRYFYYTLDEHVNFYPFKEKLTHAINLENYDCKKIHGDWLYIATLS